MNLDRITFDPNQMGGKPFIRGLSVTVGTKVGLLAVGHSFDEILKAYPILKIRTFIKRYHMPPGEQKK